MTQSLSTIFLLLSGFCLNGQNIFIDESYNDWSDAMIIYEDPAGDGPSNGIDIKRVWAANDQTYFYIRFEVSNEINLQDNNELSMYIDIDNNLNTGRKINGIGAEFIWNFGERFGQVYLQGDNDFVDHEEIDIMSSPTVSSDVFEIGMKRVSTIAGRTLSIDGNIRIRIEDNEFGGDDAPDSIGGMDYDVKTNVDRDFHQYTIDKSSETDIRVLTYNVLDDNLFDGSRTNQFRRQFQLLQPDIIAFQEVRDFSSLETRNRIQEFLPGTWFHNKSSFGNVVLLSKYPILDDEGMNGNEAHLIDVDGTELLVINMHLPCCDNNFDRQQEVDNIMEYIRDIGTGINDIDIDQNTPIIIMGDSNLVGDRLQQETLLTGDIQNNATYGADFIPDWDMSDFEDAKPLATGTPYSKTWYNPFGSFSSGRLDYIIYSGSVLWLQNTFSLSSRDMTAQDRTLYGLEFLDTEIASDHLPTVADFSFTTVSTANIESKPFSLYPNPTSGLVTIQLDNKVLDFVQVYDQLGKLVITSTDTSLNINSLPDGLYTVVMYSEQEVWAEKLIKK